MCSNSTQFDRHSTFFFFNSLKSNLWWWIKANSNKIDGIFLFLFLYRHSDVQNWCFCFYFLGLQSFHRFHLSDEGHAGRESETWKRVKSNVLFLYSTSPNIIHLCPFYTGFHHLYFSWWHKEYCNKLDGIRCNGFIQSFFYEFFFLCEEIQHQFSSLSLHSPFYLFKSIFMLMDMNRWTANTRKIKFVFML